MTEKLLDAHPTPDDDQIKHYLAGNLCRCAAYPEIIKAVKLASTKRKAVCTENLNPDIVMVKSAKDRA